MKTKTIEQTVIFETTTKEVYEALTNAQKHATFTGVPANIIGN